MAGPAKLPMRAGVKCGELAVTETGVELVLDCGTILLVLADDTEAWQASIRACGRTWPGPKRRVTRLEPDTEVLLYSDGSGRRLVWYPGRRSSGAWVVGVLQIEGGGRASVVLFRGGRLSMGRVEAVLSEIRGAGPWRGLEISELALKL